MKIRERRLEIYSHDVCSHILARTENLMATKNKKPCINGGFAGWQNVMSGVLKKSGLQFQCSTTYINDWE